MTPDRIKEELQWLRGVFQIVVVLDAGLIAYIVQPSTTPIMALLAGLSLSAGAGLILGLIGSVYRLLQDLEKPQ